MNKDHLDIDSEHLVVTGRPAPDLLVEGEGVLVINHAYGPAGDSLIGVSDVEFDGCPALTLLVRADGKEGLLHLSPLHGDPRKVGFTDIRLGTKCELLCPVSKQPLRQVGKAADGSGAGYFALYLTPELSNNAMVMISDVWGHFHSRIVDKQELVSYWDAVDPQNNELPIY